jgi:hypothetical protein
MRLRWRLLDIVLTVVLVLGIAAILLGHEDPFVRKALCEYAACPKFAHSHGWEKVAYDLGIGSVVSLFFYILIVRIPEHQRRRRLKRSFLKHYEMFKKDCIAVMLGVANGSYKWGEQDALADQRRFYEYFKEPVGDGQDRWDRFMNRLDERSVEELVKSVKIFRDEILFMLNNVDIENEEAFEFLKRMSMIIVERRAEKMDYDGRDRFCRFLWEVFSGWSFVSGLRETDIVKDMVKAM